MENTKYTEEFKQSIVSLYESEKSTQICKEYGMSSSHCINGSKYTKVQVSGNHDHMKSKNAKEISLCRRKI